MILWKEIKDIDYHKYGFIKVDTNHLLFSPKILKLDKKNREFVEKHFSDFSDIYYKSMQLDSYGDICRKRKLYNFVNSIYDQNSDLAKLVMVKGITHGIKNNLKEDGIVDKIIREILPNSGFFKKLVDRRYIWEIDEKKKFQKGIGKAFVITYINNNFNKDETWKYIKKFCYLNNDNIWCYKNENSEKIIEKTFFNYFKDGGIIVKTVNMQEPTQFNAFITFDKVVDEDGNDYFSLSKEARQDKYPFIKGVASTTKIDREDERCSKSFIGKMKRTAKGLPILDNTHYASGAEDTIGVITKTTGDAETFELEARLMKPEDSNAVDYIIKQMKTGIRYGFSIGGRISKVFREFNEKLKKEIWVLDDGELFHVALTTQPANPETLGVAISKSLGSIKNTSGKVSYNHNSKLAKQSPKIEEVKIKELPRMAFPIGRDKEEIYKQYPHHFVNDKGVMYLHEDLVIKSYSEAVNDNAPECVLNHLRTHLQVIGLSKKVEELNNLSDTVEKIGMVKEVTVEVSDEINEFVSTLKTVTEMKVDVESKKKILSKVVKDVSTKLSNVLNQLKEEDYES
jgi:hypothetical protein